MTLPIFFFFYVFLKRKKRRREYFPKNVAVGILDLGYYGRKHNFGLEQNSESFVS